MPRATLLSLTLLFTTGCAVFGIRTAEEPDFRVLLQDGRKEVREYQACVVARVVTPGDYDAASGPAFRLLFDYISGANAAGASIPMTAPVAQQPQGASIPMTAPVVQQPTAQGWSMAFVLPAIYTLETAPRPTDPRIELAEVPAATVGVVRYSGFFSEERFREKAAELGVWLAGRGWTMAGPAVSALYDPPFTIPFLRRNEVHVPVARP